MNTPVINQYGVEYMQPMTYIDEPNLYRCIFQSRKPEAELFSPLRSAYIPDIG